MNTIVQCLSSIPELTEYCRRVDYLMHKDVNANSYHSGKLFQGNIPNQYSLSGLELRIWKGKAIFKGQLRRALWLSKKAARPSKKRHKGPKKEKKKGQQIQGGQGGGSDTFFFRLQKKKSSQTAQLSLSSLRSTQCKTHCNANGMRCDLHRHEITLINDQKKKKFNTHVSKCAMFCSFCNDCSKISDFYRFLAMDSSAEITKISPRYDCDS